MSIAIRVRNFKSLRLRGAAATCYGILCASSASSANTPRTIYHLEKARIHIMLALADMLSQPCDGKTYDLPQDLKDFVSDQNAFRQQEQE